MDRIKLTHALLVISIIYVIAFYFAGSAIKPGYSQLSNFVSEYNATGTAWARTLTYAGFLALRPATCAGIWHKPAGILAPVVASRLILSCRTRAVRCRLPY